MKSTNRSIAQKLRWLNNKALKNEWKNEDLLAYLFDLDIYYDCDDEGSDYTLLEVSGDNPNYYWNVYIENEWSEEEEIYWTERIENEEDADLEYDEYKDTKKVIKVDVEKVKVNQRWF